MVIRDGERIELKRVLTHREYGIFSSQADPSRHVVRTVRTCFLLGGNSIYIEQFQGKYSKRRERASRIWKPL